MKIKLQKIVGRRSNSRFNGSLGRVDCLNLLAALARWSGLASAGHGSSPSSFGLTDANYLPFRNALQ